MLQNPLVPPAQSTRSRRSVVRGAAGAVGLLLLGNWRLASGAGEAATEANLPQVAPVPGGIVRLSLGPSQERPRAWAGEVPLLVLGDPIEWSALVGIPLSATPGEARIVVQIDGRAPREQAYTVVPKRYAEQRLKVEPKTVDLSPQDLARHERERAHQQTIMVAGGVTLELEPVVLREVMDEVQERWQPRAASTGVTLLPHHDALRVAVISIDPSRRKSGGALLGDRIRMNAIEHDNIYMRSLATRDTGSEVSAALPEVIAAAKLAGFDLVIVDNKTAPNIPTAGKMEALA